MITINPLKTTTTEAHSKLILIGEHAVVYGKPAIGIPFPLKVTSTMKSRDGGIILACSHYYGPIELVPKQFQGLTLCIHETLKYLQKPVKGLLIRLHSEIPIGRGLGSSAAIAIAIVKGLFSFYDRPISNSELMPLVQVAENYAHGNPSGIDMAAATSDVPICFQKGSQSHPLPVGAPFHLVVADTGKISDTRSAVEKVKENYDLEQEKTKQSIEEIGKITHLAKQALAVGDTQILGRLLDKNHQELTKLGVSGHSLNRFVATAKEAGALGAKLTGGGCGGCILALAHNLGHAERITKTMLKSGARQAWHFVLK